MMIKKLILITVLLLSGCAETPVQPQYVVPINSQCDQVGMYARGIVTLRDIGVPLVDIDSYTAEPTVATFPFQRVKVEAYYLKTKTPADAYTHFYQICVATGYDKLLIKLKQEEQNRLFALKPSTTLTTPVDLPTKR